MTNTNGFLGNSKINPRSFGTILKTCATLCNGQHLNSKSQNQPTGCTSLPKYFTFLSFSKFNQDITNLGGRSLIERFMAKNNTMANLLRAAFPKEDWSQRQGKYWSSTYNQRKFISEMALELNIKDLADWYNISTQVCIFRSVVHIKANKRP